MKDDARLDPRRIDHGDVAHDDPLGAQPPQPEWGAMISDGRTYILDFWWVAAMPGLAIFIVSLAFNFLGDGLRDVLDPKGAGE